MEGKSVRIGAGAAFEMDRIAPAAYLAEHGDIQYLCFETLAERTLGFAQLRRLEDPAGGYNPLTEERMRSVLPACVDKSIKIITSMGAANPQGAAEVTLRVARELGLNGIKVAVILGDDARSLIYPQMRVWETGEAIGDLKGELVSANAYLGAEPIVAALELGADVVITGRIADPSLFLAPMIYELGWRLDDWNALGKGTIVGHLMECTTQVSGGLYYDPGSNAPVPQMAHIGYPIAQVYQDGEAVISKADGTGGMVTSMTCKAQLLYELHDPESYLTPDVTADFRNVRFEEFGENKVRVLGGAGRERPEELKVLAAVMEGYIGEGEISWAGPGCFEKAQVAAEAAKINLEPMMGAIDELRVDYIGVNSILGAESRPLKQEPNEVRLRIAGRSNSREVASKIGQEVELKILDGPVGGGGIRSSVRPCLAMYSTLLPRSLVSENISVEMQTA